VEAAVLGIGVVDVQLIPALAGLAVGVALVVDRRSVVGAVEVFGVGGALGAGEIAALVAVGGLGGTLIVDVVGLVVGEVDERPLGHPEVGALRDQVGDLNPEVVPLVTD